MKGIKIILIISLLSLLACNNQGFLEDQFDNLKHYAKNIGQEVVKKMEEIGDNSKVKDFKAQAQKTMNEIYDKLSKNAEEAIEKIETTTQETLVKLNHIKDEKLEQAQKYLQESEYFQSLKRKIVQDYEEISKKVIESALRNKDAAVEFLAKTLLKANKELDNAVKKETVSAFYELH